MANVNEMDVLEKIPSGLQYAFNKVAPAFIKYDTNWGFILDKQEYVEHKKDLANISQYIYERYPLDNNKSMCFVFDKKVIQKVAHTLLPEIPISKFNEKTKAAFEIYSSEMDKLKKFIKSTLDGKNSNKGYAEYNVALYCLNSSNTLVENGVTYKAFKLTFKDLLITLGSIEGINIRNFGIVHVDAPKGTAPVVLSTDGACTACMKPVVRKDMEVDDFYVPGVCFKLVVHQA